MHSVQQEAIALAFLDQTLSSKLVFLVCNCTDTEFIGEWACTYTHEPHTHHVLYTPAHLINALQHSKVIHTLRGSHFRLSAVSNSDNWVQIGDNQSFVGVVKYIIRSLAPLRTIYSVSFQGRMIMSKLWRQYATYTVCTIQTQAQAKEYSHSFPDSESASRKVRMSTGLPR